MKIIRLILLSILFFAPFVSEAALLLRDNLKKAKSGDFIVTAQNKTCTLLLIKEKTQEKLTLEEITIPSSRKDRLSWKEWVQNGAPHHTSWVMYEINLATGKMEKYYSYTKNAWFEIPEADNFLTTLLNLSLNKIPQNKRKKVGPPPTDSAHDWRRIWQPKMVVDGQTIQGVSFDAWRTRWPNDGSELAGKVIEVYVPEENDKYPSYFPYWLQIKGMIGKAKIRIIDSGIADERRISNLHSSVVANLGGVLLR